MEKSNVWYFEEVNLFDILCPHKVKAHQQKKVHIFKEFKKNEFIYFEADHSTNIYLIVKGKVKVLKYTEEGEEQVKAVLTRGEIFGELAILGEDRRTDYAQVAEEPTVICPMSVEDLQDLMKENRPLSIKIYKLIGLRIKKLERQIQILVYKDVKTRLFEFLRDLVAEKGISKNDSVLVELPYTQKDIAHLIGASRQTVSTMMSDWQKEGILIMSRRQLVIKQPSYFQQSVVGDNVF